MNDIKVPPFTDEQKKLIEMTEKLAEKRGGKICDVDGIDDDITDLIELLEDTISRIEGLTNEEWLRSCNTEQLAEWISDITCNCWGCKRIYVEDCPNYARYKACFCDREDVLDWLKQPHTTIKE